MHIGNSTTNNPWPIEVVLTAAVLCLGTAVNSLCNQHVSNAAPAYFFAIAVISPLLGFVTYTILTFVLGRRVLGYYQSQLTPKLTLRALKYTTGIGACFAITNLLVDYGRSGSQAGVPDVSTVLTLLLLKLVVPVSLIIESIFEQKRPTKYEILGVLILLFGVLVTGSTHHHASASTTDHQINQKSPQYGLKVFCLCLASIPLSLGFYWVQVVRRRLPQITGIELWSILCVPELMFSLALSLSGQPISTLMEGLICVLSGSGTGANNCQEAMKYFWVGLPFGFAFNLAIPILIQYKGSTSVPLFRTLALPIATLLTMSPIDPVIKTQFSWGGVLAVMVCTLGLLVFYANDVRRLFWGEIREYSTIPDQEGGVDVARIQPMEYSTIPDQEEGVDVARIQPMEYCMQDSGLQSSSSLGD